MSVAVFSWAFTDLKEWTEWQLRVQATFFRSCWPPAQFAWLFFS